MDRSHVLTPSQIELVYTNLPLVQKVRNQCLNRRDTAVDLDDALQEGYLGLCKAAATYNGSCKFSTYAAVVIRNQIISYCRSLHHKNVQILSLDTFEKGVESIDQYSVKRNLTGYNGPGIFTVSQVMKLLQKKENLFSGIARKGIRALQLKLMGYTGKEIANMFQVSPNLVGAWISRAVDKLRKDSDFLFALDM